MLKSEFFIQAMKQNLGHKLEWCIRAFCLINEQEDEWKSNPYPGRIVQHHTGHYFVNAQQELVKLEDAIVGEPPFKFLDTLTIHPGDIPNNHEELLTCYGNLLFNWFAVVYAFGDKVPYQKGRAQVDKVRNSILKNFYDDPEHESLKESDKIYVSDYLKFAEGIDYSRSFTQLCVWAATEKTITPPPGIKELRDKLVEENKDSLNDLATIAKIDAALVAYDAAWLKGDPGEKFLLGNKSRAIVRKKKFLQYGAEQGLDSEGVTADMIQNSLYEGWDIDKFPAMMDSLRGGSFARGAQTALGGVSVKWLQRSSANLKVGGEDCGSTLGSPFTITPDEARKVVGMTVIADGIQDKIEDEAHAGKYLGKVVLVRNPMYCKLPYTDYCHVCLGDKLSLNPYGLSAAVSEYGSKLMLMMMSKMHGKEIATQKLNLDEIVL